MEGEIKSFINVWLSAIASLSYCYFAGKTFPKGATRAAAFLPVVCLFLLLPLHLHSIHFTGITSFFLSWLSTFKLLMFAFDTGPLSAITSLPKFLAVASLPIKLQHPNTPKSKTLEKGQKSIFNYAAKALLFALIINIYDYLDQIHSSIIVVIYCFHIYLLLEITLAVTAAAARGLLGAELEPQFNEPYLSTSLQDFWSRRWNLMVTRTLRPTVYLPALDWSSRVVGRKWAPLPAVMATFIVSALMHELIFYYLGRVRPTWEVTWFFLIHGACLVAEIVAKKALNGRLRLPRAVGRILTIGLVYSTGYWLFLPPLLGCKADEKAMAEVGEVVAFVNDVIRALSLHMFSLFSSS